MGRGSGKWQVVILRALRGSRPFPLRGRTQAETAALLRAARTLEAAGQCVLVKGSDPSGKAVTYAAAPGQYPAGR